MQAQETAKTPVTKIEQPEIVNINNENKSIISKIETKNNDFTNEVIEVSGEQKKSDNHSDLSNTNSNENDFKEKFINKNLNEKTVIEDETFDENLKLKQNEKENKINPLLEVNTNKKVENLQTANKTIDPVNMKEVIYKIERMMSNVSINKINNSVFSIDGKELGKLEIRVRQNNNEEQGVILVENEAVKEQLQKHIPDIQENLQQKGVEILAINVEVNSKNENKYSKNKHTKLRNNKILNEINNQQIKNIEMKSLTTKNYGYNTMELLA